MATPSVFLRTVLLLASALQYCHGQQCYPNGSCLYYSWNCDKNGCPENERCLARQNGNWCVYCVAGYQFTGATFQCEDVNECKDLPYYCGNNGLCINTVGSYRCGHCSQGYRYDYTTFSCQDVNECKDLPYYCGNNGLCINTVGSYRCGHCSQGYRYDYTTFSCQDASDCKVFPDLCGNNDYCIINNADQYRCNNCLPGYRYHQTTFSCQDVNECSSIPSPCNHGSCYNNGGSFWCYCNTGYTGQVCDQDASDCKVFPNLCGNNDYCIINNARQYRCDYCPPGYRYHRTSFSCQDASDCKVFPDLCGSSEYCIINNARQYRCDNCPPGYWYSRTTFSCQDYDECLSRPCHNGTCWNTPGSFSCTCHDGYTGTLCDTDVDECDSSPCQRGTCHNTDGSFECDCIPGYTGPLCNIETPDLFINSPAPAMFAGKRLRAMFASGEQYSQPDGTWTCTVEATDCSAVNVTVLLNITNGGSNLAFFSLPDGERLVRYGHTSKQATYTTPFNVELHRVQSSTVQFAYITVSANSSLTMVCGRHASASTPTDACNHCQSSPCAENTTCQNIRDDFLCLCPEGFINTLDNHTCGEKPDLVFDSQSGKQASGLEVRAMFSTSSPALEASKNWTCAVEAVDCSTEEVTLQFTVSKGYKASSFVSFSGDVSANESMSTENATLQGSVAHHMEKSGKTPLSFMVGATRPVYVVLQASRSVTVTCGNTNQPAVPSSRCLASPVPVIAGLVAAVVAVVIIVVVVVVIFKRKRLSAEKKAGGDNPVRFNDLRQREEDASAGAQPSQASGSTANQGAGAVYAVVNKPKGGKAGKVSRVTPPAYAVVNKATPPSNANPAASDSNQTYSLASGDKPPPYHLAVATGPDMRAAAANRVAAQGASQTAEDSTDYDVLGQNRRPSKPARDVTYGHLGEAVGDDDVDYGYDHTGVRSSGDVINSVYDTARAPSAPDDDVMADGTYDRMNLGQGQRKEVVGSTYDRVDPTYTNSAFSAN